MARKQDANLIPKTSDQNREEASKNGRKGGIASGKARREKKALKQTLEILMTMPIKAGKIDDLEDITSLADLNGKNITAQEAMILKQLQRALNGDARSTGLLLELMKMTQTKEEEAGVQIIDDF